MLECIHDFSVYRAVATSKANERHGALAVAGKTIAVGAASHLMMDGRTSSHSYSNDVFLEYSSADSDLHRSK